MATQETMLPDGSLQARPDSSGASPDVEKWNLPRLLMVAARWVVCDSAE